MTDPRLPAPVAGMKVATTPQLVPQGLSLGEAVRQHAQNRARGGSSEAPAPLRVPSLPQIPAFRPFPGYKGVK